MKFVILLLLASLSRLLSAETAGSKPNIIFVLFDDMGYGQGYTTACIGKWHLGMDWVDGKPLVLEPVPAEAGPPGLSQAPLF